MFLITKDVTNEISLYVVELIIIYIYIYKKKLFSRLSVNAYLYSRCQNIITRDQAPFSNPPNQVFSSF